MIRDKNTRLYYQRRGPELCRRYDSLPSPLLALLKPADVAGKRVIDIGCGSGRDLALMKKWGAEIRGIEPTEELRRGAEQNHPELEGKLFPGTLPDLPAEAEPARWDWVIASAVLMHLCRDETAQAQRSLGALLAPGGRLCLSYPIKRQVSPEGRDSHGRYMHLLPPEELERVFLAEGLILEERAPQQDGLERKEILWNREVWRRAPY